MGATRANDFPARRTSADKRQVIIPGRDPIRTALNAVQVSTDQKVGGSSPSERAGQCARSETFPVAVGPRPGMHVWRQRTHLYSRGLHYL
jgi:hypothetical protein